MHDVATALTPPACVDVADEAPRLRPLLQLGAATRTALAALAVVVLGALVQWALR